MTTPPSDLNRLDPGQVRSFANSLNLVGQQRKSRCVSHVMADLGYSEKGISFTDELMESFEAEDFDGDISPTPIHTADQKRRESRFKSFSVDRMVGTRERAEKLVDPTNSVVQSMSAAIERKRDRSIIGQPGAVGGLFGDQYEVDVDGDIVRTAFPTAQILAVNENAYYKGLADGATAPTAPTVFSRQKIARAKVILDKSFYADMDGDVPIVFLEEDDLQAFCTSEETINKDYASHELASLERLRSGDLSVYKGMRFVKVASGLLPKVPGQASQWYLPIFFKSAIMFKERPLVTTKIETMQSQRWRWIAYYEAQHATLRREDKAVVWAPVTRA